MGGVDAICIKCGKPFVWFPGVPTKCFVCRVAEANKS